MAAPVTRYAGTRVARVEDTRLLTGHGTYVDDIVRPGMLHACFVRSPFAHAKINSIDVSAALALPVIIAGVRTALVLIVGTAALASFTGAGGLGQLITTGIKLQQSTTLVVGAILVAALALAIDWLARVVEMVASPKGLK